MEANKKNRKLKQTLLDISDSINKEEDANYDNDDALNTKSKIQETNLKIGNQTDFDQHKPASNFGNYKMTLRSKKNSSNNLSSKSIRSKASSRKRLKTIRLDSIDKRVASSSDQSSYHSGDEDINKDRSVSLSNCISKFKLFTIYIEKSRLP